MKMFTIKTILTHYSLIPTIALTGFATAMSASYICYMASSKPDLHFRLFDKNKLSEWSVAPDEFRRLFRHKDLKPHNAELEQLRKEIQAHYEHM